MVWQRQCFPGSCQKWFTVSIPDPATLFSKSAGGLQVCTNTLEHARLEKLSLVHTLVFSKLRALPGPLSSLENTLASSSSCCPVLSAPPQSSQFCLHWQLQFLVLSDGKAHPCILSGNSSHLLLDVQNGTGWGPCSLELVSLANTPAVKMQSVTRTPLYSPLSLFKKTVASRTLAGDSRSPLWNLPSHSLFLVWFRTLESAKTEEPPFAVIRNRHKVPLLSQQPTMFLFFLQPFWNWCSLGNRCSLTLWM